MALESGEFKELLPHFHGGEHPATFIANVDKVTGDFVGSNLHHQLSTEEFRGRNLATKNECLDGVYFRPAIKNAELEGPTLEPLSCEVMQFPLDNPFGRASDHFGIKTVFKF